jgi:large subunit ribosomal protein L7Ae
MAPKASKPAAKPAKPAAKKATPAKPAKAGKAPAKKAPANAAKAAKRSSKPSQQGKKAAAKLASKKKLEAVVTKKAEKEREETLFIPRPKNFGIGNDLKPKHDVTRMVRWPNYVRRQRQKAVLLRRVKVPPAINQFNMNVDSTTKKSLYKFARKYKPEPFKARQDRLRKEAEARVKDPKAKLTKKTKEAGKYEIITGLSRVTRFIEQQKAKLVLIANDVDPLELVLWMPALCKKQDVPYAIVKNKASLGQLAGFKKCTCIAFHNIKSADKGEFDKLVTSVTQKFADRYEDAKRKWGGLRLGRKHQIKMSKRAEKMKK